jgi:predicted regulator of Ras-like GTPase activity (Roadblock/LC7/MglB family)
MTPNNLFKDLISVPGLRNVLLFKKDEQPIMKDIHEEFSLPDFQKSQVLAGLKMAVDQIEEDSFRVELRGEYGRFIICSISTDTSIAFVTNENLNVPLLEIALKQYKDFAEQNQDEIIFGFRDEEIPDSHSSKIPAAIASYSSTKALISFESVAEIMEPNPKKEVESAGSESVETVGNDFETDCPDFKSYQELSDNFGEISSIAFKFLGKSVVANYWKQTQPEILRHHFEIFVNGTVKATKSTEVPGPDELLAGTNWIEAFICRCEKIITDIPFQEAGYKRTIKGS